MFIGIAGPICSGKRTIANFLISNHNFIRLRLKNPEVKASSNDVFEAITTPTQTPPVDDINDLTSGIQNVQVNRNDDVWFDSMGEMVDYVTKRWRENFVTVDIWTEEDLEIVVKRPFFLLISVDAPISSRWKRFNERYPSTPCGVNIDVSN
jgi:dCMP deaminase